MHLIDTYITVPIDVRITLLTIHMNAVFICMVCVLFYIHNRPFFPLFLVLCI